MYQLNNLFAATAVHPSELMSVAAFQHLKVVGERARKIVEADRVALSEFLNAQPGVSAVRTAWGTTAFLRLRSRDTDEFLTRLRAEQETSASPGRFFEMSSHFRVGMGVNSDMFREGLRRIALTL
jgi:aspartate/methionine/tyrosine aminotransferase